MFNKTVYQEWASGDKAHLYSQNVLSWTVTVDGFIEPFHKDIDDQTKRMLFLYRNPVPICQFVDCATAQGGSFWGSGEHQHSVYNLGQLPSHPTPPPPNHHQLQFYLQYRTVQSGSSIKLVWVEKLAVQFVLAGSLYFGLPRIPQIACSPEKTASKLHTDSQLSSHSQLGQRTVEGSPHSHS